MANVFRNVAWVHIGYCREDRQLHWETNLHRFWTTRKGETNSLLSYNQETRVWTLSFEGVHTSGHNLAAVKKAHLRVCLDQERRATKTGKYKFRNKR